MKDWIQRYSHTRNLLKKKKLWNVRIKKLQDIGTGIFSKALQVFWNLIL